MPAGIWSTMSSTASAKSGSVSGPVWSSGILLQLGSVPGLGRVDVVDPREHSALQTAHVWVPGLDQDPCGLHRAKANLAEDDHRLVEWDLRNRCPRTEFVEMDGLCSGYAGDRPLIATAHIDQQDARGGTLVREQISQLKGRDLGHRAPRGCWDGATRHTRVCRRCHRTGVLVVDQLGDGRALTAHDAVRILVHGKGVPALTKGVVHQQPTNQRVPDADDELHRLGRLNGSDGRAENAEHPALGARRHQTRWRRYGKDTAVAGSVLRPPDAGLTVEAIDRTPDVRLAQQDACVVEQI